MKRVISILTALALLLSLTVSALAAETDSLPWYADAQNYVMEAGIMTATDGDFQPDGPVTRAVVFQTLYRMAGAPVSPAASLMTRAGSRESWSRSSRAASGAMKRKLSGSRASSWNQ